MRPFSFGGNMRGILNQSRDAPALSGRQRIIIAAAALVFFAGVARFRPSIERLLRAGEETAKVAHVVDGDTVILADGRSVRYVGIDTPEMDAATEHTRDQARRAKESNARLVDGKVVRLEFDVERKDKYGRTLAYVYVGGESINARLVAEGLARAEFFGDNRRHLDEYKKLEAEAKAKGLGVWEGAAASRRP